MRVHETVQDIQDVFRNLMFVRMVQMSSIDKAFIPKAWNRQQLGSVRVLKEASLHGSIQLHVNVRRLERGVIMVLHVDYQLEI